MDVIDLNISFAFLYHILFLRCFFGARTVGLFTGCLCSVMRTCASCCSPDTRMIVLWTATPTPTKDSPSRCLWISDTTMSEKDLFSLVEESCPRAMKSFTFHHKASAIGSYCFVTFGKTQSALLSLLFLIDQVIVSVSFVRRVLSAVVVLAFRGASRMSWMFLQNSVSRFEIELSIPSCQHFSLQYRVWNTHEVQVLLFCVCCFSFTHARVLQMCLFELLITDALVGWASIIWNGSCLHEFSASVFSLFSWPSNKPRHISLTMCAALCACVWHTG